MMEHYEYTFEDLMHGLDSSKKKTNTQYAFTDRELNGGNSMNRFYDWKVNAVDPLMTEVWAMFNKPHMDKLAEVFDLYERKQFETIWCIMTNVEDNLPFDLLDKKAYNKLLETQMTLASVRNYKGDILRMVSPIDVLNIYDEFMIMHSEVDRYLDILHRLKIVNDHAEFECNW